MHSQSASLQVTLAEMSSICSTSLHPSQNSNGIFSENYSDQLWEKFVPVIEKDFWNSRLSLKAKNLQKFSRSVYSNSDGQSNFFLEYFFNLFLKVSQIK